MEDHGHRFHHQQRQQHEHRHHLHRGAMQENLKEGFLKFKRFFKKPQVQVGCLVIGVVILVGCAATASVYLFREDLTMTQWVNSIFRGL